MTQRERLIELLENAPTAPNGERNVATLADHLLENGVIVPPCKVGDKVWFLNIYPSICMYRNFVYEAMVVRVYVEHDNELTLAIRVKNEWGTIEYTRIREEIGKTVFLTREDAEKALAERSKT